MVVARLNGDVLTIICEFLTDVAHVLSFALTSAYLVNGRKAKTAGKPPIAWKYKLFSVTPRSLAYTAVLVRHALMTDDFAATDPHGFNYEGMFTEILQLFKDEKSTWCKETLAWWNSFCQRAAREHPPNGKPRAPHSALHHIAIRRLLSMRPVYLTGSTSILRFHSFVFADKLARAGHIRALEIGTRFRHLLQAPPPDDDSLLIDILTACPRLEHISVAIGDAPLRRTDGPRITDVIAAIQSLRSLSVHGKLADTVAFFHQIRAPLRMLGIHCRNPRGGHWSPAALEDFLPRFASTLEELELNAFHSDPDETETQANISTPSRSVFTITQYPAVRSFSVTSFVGMPVLDHLQHLFPGLDGTLSLSTFGTWTNEDEFAGVRAANQRAQESERDNPLSRPWKKLDRVVCNVFMFYVLGLRCPVRLVMLDNGSLSTKRYVAEALRENPIPRLKLSLTLSHGLGVFEGLFPPELGGTLTYLTLFCEDDQDAWPQGGADAATVARRRWDDVLDKMSSALQPLHNLTHLRVVFHCSIYHADFSPDAHGEEYLRAVRGPAFELAEETVASLVCPLPSLEYIFLTTAGYLAHYHGSQVYERWHVARAWRVTERPTGGTKDGKPILVGLHDEVAETIIRKEELVLSEADEYKC